jgi:flagellar biosynthetic protein FliR
MEFPIASAWGFALVLFRTAGLFLSAPILSARVVQARVRMALAVLLAWAAFCAAGAPAALPPGNVGALALAVAGETALGVLAGLAARFILLAALTAGHLAAQGMGLGLGGLLDPASGAESNALPELVYLAAQSGAIALGIHREAVTWLARSAIAFPPGAPLGLRELAAKVLWETTGSIALSARLAFPVLGAVLVGHVVMAGMSRSAPQLNLGTLGFSVAILAGGGAFYLVAPAVAELAARAAFTAMSRP